MPPQGPPEPAATGTVPPLGRRGRLGLTVLWCSFLAAGVGTMVFFAFIDPVTMFTLLAPAAALPDRTALYSLGFIFFWVICALASLLTVALFSAAAPRP